MSHMTKGVTAGSAASRGWLRASKHLVDMNLFLPNSTLSLDCDHRSLLSDVGVQLSPVLLRSP